MFPELQTVFFIIIIASSLGIGLLVIMKNPYSIVNRSFFVFLIGIIVTVLGFLFLTWHYPFNLFDKTIHYGGLIVLFGLFLFSQVFPHSQKLPRNRWLLYIPFPLIALFVIPFNLLIRQATFGGNGIVAPQNGPLLLPYMIFWGSYFLLSIYFLFRTYIGTKGKEKTQMHYLFAGFSFFLVCLFTFDLLLPIVKISYLSFAGPVSSLVLIWLVAYAIIKHELLDIRIIIQRGLIYIILFGMILGVYIVFLQFLGSVLNRTTNITTVLSAGITMVIGIFFVRPLEDYFRKVTDSIFFKDHYNYPLALHQLSKILHTYIAQEDIVKHSSKLLTSIFKNEWVRFHLVDKHLSLSSSEDAALSVDIIFKEEKIGILKLGPKKSGDDYTRGDKQLLDTFVFQAAVAFEKARLYEKVKEYNVGLEELVDKRTSEVKKLQEDQRQAMIDISHNLQTPLTIIKGELDLLLDSPVHADKMQHAKKSVHKISQFIRQLLHLAKLDQDAFTVEMTRVNLSALLDEQCEYFEVMAKEKGVQISCSIEEKIYILGNKKFLSELITNLVTNSIKYRKRQSKQSLITISLFQNEKNACMTVTDNGMGIAPNDLPDIFTRFYRGSYKSNTVGTGLGLAICKKIVEKHSGSIAVESIPGEKTVFMVSVPIYNK
jgi:signal transduction histidine kinase